MHSRCANCNAPDGSHRTWCKKFSPSFTTERGVQQTSAERYKDHEVGSGDVCGPAAPVDGYSSHQTVGQPVKEAIKELREKFGMEPDYSSVGLRSGITENPLARKHVPLASGLLDYFPAALAAVATLSQIGNEQHNPGKPMYWNRAKSGDEADALLRHLADRGTFDIDGQRHSVKVAWRALALLQKELEAAGAPMAPGARVS